jgi:hypothetical protein
MGCVFRAHRIFSWKLEDIAKAQKIPEINLSSVGFKVSGKQLTNNYRLPYYPTALKLIDFFMMSTF